MQDLREFRVWMVVQMFVMICLSVWLRNTNINGRASILHGQAELMTVTMSRARVSDNAIEVIMSISKNSGAVIRRLDRIESDLEVLQREVTIRSKIR